MKIFDVLVIGGGHAGIEAAHIAAKMGATTLLLTIDSKKIGWMPCNPSVGGLGKGHIVYEIEALGGLMPKLCSKTYLQARMLNTSKGPAVQGLRLQIDKYAYNTEAISALSKTDNLTIRDGLVSELLIDLLPDGSKKISGVKISTGESIFAQSVVITSGTFLNGRVHVGLENHAAGRMGEESAIQLSLSIEKILGAKLGRLKTGTPPRLLRSSIDFSKTEKQVAHELDYLFEWASVHSKEKQACFITSTNEVTHKIIADNLERSAMYSGNIKGVGPRYCPSIEDKIGRFRDRNSHHVFIEPEGGDNSEVYPAGLSTSLPADVQEEYIHSIAGFENAVITKYGYAVEYDFLDPRALTHSLETKNVKNLFFAGQVNGTTGYEEAAGQGIIAGINAALKASDKNYFTLNRTESYIGIMIDDLVSLGTNEPYRMFTSRAERRLVLRQDNVFMRLMPYAKELGLISQDVYDQFLVEKEMLEQGVSYLLSLPVSNKLRQIFAAIEFTGEIAREASKAFPNANSRVLLGMHAGVKYFGYIEREKKEAEKMIKYQNLHILATIDYSKISGLSKELASKLEFFKPATIAQAQLIQGMTPAAISLLIFNSR